MTNSFLRVGSVVPMSVLNFDDTGTCVGLVADPVVTPPGVAEWAKTELAHIPDWVPGPDVVSPHCGHVIPKVLPGGAKISFFCTELPKHSTAHEARGGGVEVLASAPVRKPSPRKRTAA